MTKKRGMIILEKAAEKLDIPVDIMAGATLVEIYGTRQILVENHRGILEYTEEEVKLNTDGHVLKISGEELCVTAMTGNQIRISGEITALQYIEI